jgi:anti-sigma-K factor RskA
MSDDTTMGDPDGGDVSAAEYVLGVLGAAERRAVERRLAREPALAAEVAFWEERLSGLAAGIAPAAPPPEAWSRIESAIVAETAAAARAPSLWQSLAFWRGLTAASASLAAASIAALAWVALLPAHGPLTATLGGGAGQPNFVAAVTATGNTLVIVPAALLASDPRSYELWLIPSSGDTRPRSLGLIEPGRPVRLDIPAALAARITPDATLAVTREPPGGSPNGQPSLPPIAAGKLTNL